MADKPSYAVQENIILAKSDRCWWTIEGTPERIIKVAITHDIVS